MKVQDLSSLLACTSNYCSRRVTDASVRMPTFIVGMRRKRSLMSVQQLVSRKGAKINTKVATILCYLASLRVFAVE
jgi:hypothetical protein